MMNSSLHAPFATVLMTVYNGGAYLKSALESVLNQTYRDFEFLIINDCSTDNTLETISAFDDPRIVVHTNEINLGQTKSLNIGFRLAKGAYVARMDADDLAFPFWLEEQARFVQEHPEYDIVSAGLVTMDTRNRLRKIYYAPEKREDMIFRAIVNSPVNHGGSLMKKETVINAGGYKEQYRVAADYGLWVKLLQGEAKITSIPKIVMAIRRHEASASRIARQTQDVVELSDIIQTHVRNISDFDISPEESRLLCRAHYDEAGISWEEFLVALKIHEKVYACLKRENCFSQTLREQWKIQQRKTFFLRRVYGLIAQKEYAQIKTVAEEAQKSYGLGGLFGLVRMLASVYAPLTAGLPWLYEQLIQIKTLISLKGRMNAEKFLE